MKARTPVGDSLRSWPIRLSMPTQEWIADTAFVRIQPASPMGFLLFTPRHTDLADRHNAGVELTRVTRDASPEVMAALRVVADPHSRLRVMGIGENTRAVITNYLIRDQVASTAYYRDEGLLIAKPQSLSNLFDHLLQTFTSRSTLAPISPVLLNASLFAVMTRIWFEAGLAERQAITREELEGSLQGGIGTNVSEHLETLLRAGILEAVDTGFSLTLVYRHVMELIATGQAVKLELNLLEGAFPWDADAMKPSAELSFFGPADRRMVIITTTESEFARRAGFSKAPGYHANERIVIVADAEPGIVASALSTLVRLEKTKPGDAKEIVPPPPAQPDPSKCRECGGALKKGANYCSRCRAAVQ